MVVRHGFVTLEGTVDSTAQKAAAEAAVKHVEGVWGVSNRLRIEQVGRHDKAAAVLAGPNRRGGYTYPRSAATRAETAE
jgi:hypothetical protein